MGPHGYIWDRKRWIYMSWRFLQIGYNWLDKSITAFVFLFFFSFLVLRGRILVVKLIRMLLMGLYLDYGGWMDSIFIVVFLFCTLLLMNSNILVGLFVLFWHFDLPHCFLQQLTFFFVLPLEIQNIIISFMSNGHGFLSLCLSNGNLVFLPS